jgi:hypothetical protein
MRDWLLHACCKACQLVTGAGGLAGTIGSFAGDLVAIRHVTVYLLGETQEICFESGFEILLRNPHVLPS